MDFFAPNLAYLDFFLKSVISLFLGAIIGYERQTKKKPAGIKTHSLICFGSALFTYLSLHFSNYGDPARIAAQIITGIGFLGAGTIFMSRYRVKGLTSAATVWVSSAIGMLVGAGFIIYSFIAVSLVVTLYYLARPRGVFLVKAYTISVEIIDWELLETISKLMDEFDFDVHHKSIERKEDIILHLGYTSTPVAQHLFLKKLFTLDGAGQILHI